MARSTAYPRLSNWPILRPLFAIVVNIVALAAAKRLDAQPGGPATIIAAPVIQPNGQQISMPSKLPVSRQSGCTLTVEPRWTSSYGGYGYRPLEVTLTAPRPVKNAVAVRIRMHMGWNDAISAEQDFEIAAGSSSATTAISLPIYQQWSNYMWWDIWIDGVRDKDLSLDPLAASNWAGGMASAAANLKFLVMSPATRNRSLVANSQMEFSVFSLEQASWPTRWLDYTTFDVISLTLDEAQQLATSRPAVFQAVARWARAGGQIWICEAGDKWEHLPKISQLFNLSVERLPALEDRFYRRIESTADDDVNSATAAEPSGAGAVGAKKDDSTAAAAGKSETSKADATKADFAATKPVESHVEGWRPLRFRTFRADGRVFTFQDTRTGNQRTERDPDTIAQLQKDSNYLVIDERIERSGGNRPRSFARDSSDWFLEQPLDLGTVRVFRGANEAGNFAARPTLANPNALVNTNSSEELPRALTFGMRRTPRWEMRYGLTPDGANPEFDRLLVMGVGRAPVTEFRVLISLFVLLIGPVNYWLLKRAKRLPMMVLTVPLAALATTAALFAYAVAADGFGTRVRAHSFTKLDQRTGEATCWSRLSYYSGLAPGKGLTMPADVAIYPILPSWAPDANMADRREIIWGDQEAQLTQGWLYSRTPTQYLAVRARKSPRQLQVLDLGDKLRVKNELGTKIRYLVVISAAGNAYEGEAIEQDGSTYLKPTVHEDAVRKFGKLVVDNMPQAPPELGGSGSNSQQTRPGSRFQYRRFSPMMNPDGRLSENLAEMALMDLGGLSGQAGLNLPPKSYVAVTEFGPEVETGISYAKEEGSFHVIEGRW